MIWIAGADILYACEDFEFDRAKRLHSVPAAVGIRPALYISIACHIIAVAALVAVGLTAHLGLYYRVAVGAITLLLIYEHAIVKPATSAASTRRSSTSTRGQQSSWPAGCSTSSPADRPPLNTKTPRHNADLRRIRNRADFQLVLSVSYLTRGARCSRSASIQGRIRIPAASSFAPSSTE
jgi:hypothetical protein